MSKKSASLVEDAIAAKEIRTEKLGLGVAATAATGTYTQTYSTAARTVANPTGTSMGDLLAVQNTGWGATNEADFDKITTAVDQLIADNLNLRQVLTALIDDLQEKGVIL